MSDERDAFGRPSPGDPLWGDKPPTPTPGDPLAGPGDRPTTPGDPLASPGPPAAPVPADTPPSPAVPPPPPMPAPERPGYTSPPPPGAGGPMPQPLASAAGGHQLAGWGRRAAAAIIDVVLISAVAFGLLAVFGVGFAATDSDGGVFALIGAAIVSMLVFAVVALLYAPVMMWKTNGQTVGRMVARTRVVRAGGQPMDFGTAMMREVVIKALAIGIASAIIPFIPYLVDVLWPLWDDENRALHDFPVNTRTVVT